MTRPFDGVAERGGVGLRLVLLFAGLAAVAGGSLYLDYRGEVGAPVLREGDDVEVEIPEGASWPGVLEVLERKGLVDEPTYFDIWARRQGLPPEVKAGTYRLEGPMTPSDLAQKLRSGVPARDVRVTFREGDTIFHIAERVDEAGLAGREALLQAARDGQALEEAGIEGESFEGYLFPETYRFDEEASAADVVDRAHEQWREEWRSLTDEHPGALERLEERHGLDRHGVVTLASIVEAETSVPSERPLVARVMLNRLDASMKLQVDPTCVYGEETYDEVPSPSSCRDPMNRYSTYVVDGLPPGPIGNPGRTSLEAVLDPADGEDAKGYLYFVARDDGTGRHVFSRTYRRHKRAIEKYLD